MNPFTFLRTEETRLETLLRADPSYRQLEAVRAALAALGDAYGQSYGKPDQLSVCENTARQNAVATQRAPRPVSIASAATRIAVEEMRRTGRRMSSTSVLPLLAAEGIVVSGKNPQATIAGTLSANRALFDNAKDERGVGYGLVEWSQPIIEGATNGDNRQDLDPKMQTASPVEGDAVP